MPIAINRDSRLIPALDYSISTHNIHRESHHQMTPQIAAATLNGRLVVNAANGCFDCVKSIPNCMKSTLKTISDFFVHRYADFRLFVRAYNSVGGSTSQRDIERRINEVTQFITVIENCGDNRNAVRERFQRLSPGVRTLFFYVDQNYIEEFVRSPLIAEEIAQELIRECEQVISFQRQMISVNAFYRMFTGATEPPVSISSTTDGIMHQHPREPFFVDNFNWFGGLFRDQFGPRRYDGVTIDVSSGTTLLGVNLNVSGTVPYIQNEIPAAVQNKADEINRLKALFVGNPPHEYNDPVALDFMAMPVFDVSHPGVQNALRAAAVPGATSAATAALNNRVNRHLIDKDSLEAHIRTGSSWAPAKCPTCRHPEHGGIRREYLRIDTALQDEILQFLRARVGTSSSIAG